MTRTSPFRPEMLALEQNGITRLAFPRMEDPAVIPLWFGEGDEVTPDFIRAAAVAALDAGETFYTHTRGHPRLRAALKRYLDDLYGLDVADERIAVPGASMSAITIAAQTALTSGDHALIVGPVWPNIDLTYRMTGASVGYVMQRQTDNGWTLDLDELIDAITPKTRSIFVNSPCNPTGWMMPPEQQRALVQVCRERGILLIADEVYHRTVFDGRVAPSFMTVAQPDDPVIVINGFSKAWAMTGWRVGWMVGPAGFETQWTTLSEFFNTGATVFAQLGAIAALEQGEDFIAATQARLRDSRALVLDRLGAHPRLELAAPEGGFYVYPRVRGLTDSMAFAQGVLDEVDVGLAPGYTFGPDQEDRFRLCFAASSELLGEGLDRLVDYLDRG
ncbi:MAG: pyridoxal phosphate-dependent aminotransferase [Pseudomonadota bacterium]